MYEKREYETCQDDKMLKTYLYCYAVYTRKKSMQDAVSKEPVFLSLILGKEEMKE